MPARPAMESMQPRHSKFQDAHAVFVNSLKETVEAHAGTGCEVNDMAHVRQIINGGLVRMSELKKETAGFQDKMKEMELKHPKEGDVLRAAPTR